MYRDSNTDILFIKILKCWLMIHIQKKLYISRQELQKINVFDEKN